jgi:anti-anti-sigma factor
MAQGGYRTAAVSRGGRIQVLSTPDELDLATADALAARGCAAAAHAGLLLLDLSGLSFCDARGLRAFVQIANHADRTGCRYGLITPQPRVAKVLRICRLHQRLPVFATIGEAVERLAAMTGTRAQSKGTSDQCERGSTRTAGQTSCGQAVEAPVDSLPVTVSPPKASPERSGRRAARAGTGQAAVRPPRPSRATTAASFPAQEAGQAVGTKLPARSHSPGREAGAWQGGPA